MAKDKKISTVVSNPNEKKKVVRYDQGDEDIVSNIYAGKKGLEKLGNPDRVKVTLEAADGE